MNLQCPPPSQVEPDSAGKAVVFFPSRDSIRFLELLLKRLGGRVASSANVASARNKSDRGDQESEGIVTLPLLISTRR